MKFYAVRKGRAPGIYTKWEDCRNQIYQFSGAEYKSFQSRQEAEAFMDGVRPGPQTSPAAQPAKTSVEIWVDGSCMPGPEERLRLGWGLLVKRNGKEIHRDFGDDIPSEASEHRNVAGEILGILKALEWCQQAGVKEVTLYYDYQGLESWATGAWKAKLPFTKTYAQTVQQAGITIHWVKVAAHSGNPENDLVDQLAKMGAMGRKKD